MPLHVQRKVVGPGEGSLTQVTLKRPMSSMLPVVTSQLVRPRKLPPAAFPVAMVWFFTCVGSHVSLQMGTFGISLPTSRKLTVVGRGAFSGPRPAAPFGLAFFWRVKLQNWRRRRSEYHSMHGGMVRPQRLPVHTVLSMKMWHTLVMRILRWSLIIRVHILLWRCHLGMVGMRAHVTQVIVFVRQFICGHILLQTMRCVPLGVREGGLHGTVRVFLVVQLPHVVPCHHARLFSGFLFNFISHSVRVDHMELGSRSRIKGAKFSVLASVRYWLHTIVWQRVSLEVQLRGK